jgi:hypothetical protein
MVAVIPVRNNKLAGEPELISRGFMGGKSSHDLLRVARNEVKRLCELGPVRPAALEQSLQDFFYRETQSRRVVHVSFVDGRTSTQLAPELRQMRPVRVEQIL